jgi:NADPH-dependent 2,4-dienoyl-CoA reductase/sulfur reductase-like enzyme
LVARPAVAQAARPAVVVVGGGFGGATLARTLRRLDREITVTLVEANRTFTACPFSNGVIAGLRDISAQQFSYEKVVAEGVVFVAGTANLVDPQARRLIVGGNTRIRYDRLVLAPGVDMRWDALPGYDEAAAERMPHAWKAGEQTLLLRRQLEAMEDGGLVVISVPTTPYRCPPAPYERASLMAHYLKIKKPRSKLIILDAKDEFSNQRLFQNAWKELYPGLLEWVPLSSSGKVTEVDPSTNTLMTDFDRYQAKVANVIPPQKAGRVAELAGVADRTGWCPIDPVTFESKLQRYIHVLGDAIIGEAMPKSAVAANAQAKVCAAALVKLMRGEKAAEPKLVSTCYSLVAPDYAFHIAGVYRPVNGVMTEVQGSGGVSKLDAPPAIRAREASFADGWFQTTTTEMFG